MGYACAILHTSPMVTKNETSKPEAADPVSVAIGDTLDTSPGLAAFSGLEEGAGAVLPVAPGLSEVQETSTPHSPQESTGLLARYNPLPPTATPLVAEAQDGAPVANESEDYTLICSWCSFVAHVGRGPVSHILCNICRIEFFPEVPLG